jgi:glycine hydroxymethyltransferase
MSGFIITDPLSKIDPEIEQIIAQEAARQKQKLIFIPSESAAPTAIRESLGSVLQNIYAEGFPDEESRLYSQDEILDLEKQLAHFHRHSDPRHYKGVEFADVIEELARRRCAEVFAANGIGPDDIFVNVQPLSGAPANNAVYHALINPGDVIMGMNLFHGGHLTHGSSVNRSGKLYQVYHYSADPQTEQINYDEVERIALERKPKVIICGYSSYPWVPDFARFRKIADACGAYLLADVSHIAGLIAAGALPSPVGHAHVVTFTTHKTLCGPRGAVILSFDESISKKIDKAVFPGEQGGPHLQVMAAMATTFKLARQKPFIDFQNQILKNCKALNDQLKARGFRIAYNGTNTHLTNIDCKSVVGPDGTPLSGDMAARIMDIAGLVANSNAIPGDKSAMRASGVRLGTPWLTQRGLVEKDMVEIADIIADLLFSMQPYSYSSGQGTQTRAKLDFDVLEKIKIRVRKITERCLSDEQVARVGYPQFSYTDDLIQANKSGSAAFELKGEHLRQTLNYVLSNDVETLAVGECQATSLCLDKEIIEATLLRSSETAFVLSLPVDKAALAAAWLRDLSDGFIRFDEDLFKRIPGPFTVKSISDIPSGKIKEETGIAKPYFIGIDAGKSREGKPLPDFFWKEENGPVKETPLHQRHIEMGAKMVPFAGWDMPVWYTTVLEEHMATRKASGLFDVSHMGVYQAEGVDAPAFLDCVCANDISTLGVGESLYTHFLDPQANVIDDLLVYHHKSDQYLVVVNASNDDKDWAWLNAVKNGNVKVDLKRPWARAFGSGVILKNLRSPHMGAEMRVDIALQGPLSRDILCKIGISDQDIAKLKKLKRTQLCHITWNGQDLIASRTGYTGEKMAFEIFIHPERALEFWNKVIAVGSPLGLKPCGLGARDSLRTEAGLPLYGHEMGGKANLHVDDAGFGSYVKTYKPWFIGRQAYLEHDQARKSEVVRFRFVEKRVRMAHGGDAVLNERGKVIGFVTSCAIDQEEFLTGQAYIEKSSSAEGTNIFVFQNIPAMEDIITNELTPGKKVQLPEKAVVLSRFPK